jgi:hypothetical protein
MLKLSWKAHSFDIIHYNFGETIFPARVQQMKPVSAFARVLVKLYYLFLHMIDLRILKCLGKCIAVTFQGSDARQGDYIKENFEFSIADHVETGYYSPQSDAEKRQVIAKFEQYADLIYYISPDTGHVLPSQAKFMPTPRVDSRIWKPIPQTRNLKPIVVHAPSHRGVKGTKVILDVVENLKQDGIDFEFILVENLSNIDARKIYEKADLLIDQLYAGWYGGLAVECMALSKPVMCYIRENDLKFIPKKMRESLPIIRVTPNTLEPILSLWLTEKTDNLPSRGIQSRKFIETWHNPLKIAAQLKKDYQLCREQKQNS